MYLYMRVYVHALFGLYVQVFDGKNIKIIFVDLYFCKMAYI